MVVKWEGENPADTTAWIDVLHEALDEDVRSYWVRFYRQPGGWRFDLEYREASGSDETTFRQADESTTLQVHKLLVASGKPLDPGWKPFAASASAAIAQSQAPLFPPPSPTFAEAAQASLGEATPPAAEASHPTGRRRGRRRRGRGPAPPEPVREAETEAVEAAAPLAPVTEPEKAPEPQPPPAPRPPGWRRLRPALVYLPAVLLMAFAGWLTRGRPQPPQPAPSPSAPASEEPSAAEKRLKELEAVVAQLRQERAQALPGRRPGAPAPAGTSQPAPVRRPAPPPVERSGEIPAPTSVPGPTPAPLTAPAAAPAPAVVPPPTEVPSARMPSPTDTTAPAAPASAVAADRPPPPPPVQRGALVELSDAGVTPPAPVTQSRPRYPPLALERRLSGTVWLNALVDETGAVIDVTLVRAAPRGLDFEDAATRYVRGRLYRPATKQGVPVRVWLPIVVEFRQPGR